LDYTALTLAKANMFGLGGRVGFNVTPHVVMEGEMAWDFERSTTATITSGGITNTFRSDLRLLHGFLPEIPDHWTGTDLCFYEGRAAEFWREWILPTPGNFGQSNRYHPRWRYEWGVLSGGGLEFMRAISEFARKPATNLLCTRES